MITVVEIHTESGSQYTVVQYESGNTYLHVTRKEGHYLPRAEEFLVQDWTLFLVDGLLRARFNCSNDRDAGSMLTSPVTQVRQQFVREAVNA